MDPSTLRDRLRDVIRPIRQTPGTQADGVTGSGADGQQAAEASFSREAHQPGDVLGGAWREIAAGRSFVVRRRIGPETKHGSQRIGDFADACCGRSSAAALMGSDAAQEPFLFFDLETTGLSGGAGTYAFLVGYGWFEPDGGFVTEQHLMVDFAAERSMLHLVASEMGRAGAIVTFNGKSFDAPVLETRFLFHRLKSPCGLIPNVDLLHSARRFWGGTNDLGCSLGVLEQQVLGLRRSNDVPGFEIPARYFQFVRSGDSRPLAAVFQHNRLDLISLAGLTARVFHLVERGPTETTDAREALALGRVYTRAGLDERAEGAFDRAVQLSAPSGSDGLVKIEALRALALGARRDRRYEAAAAHWRHLLEVPGCPRRTVREALEALAIHHEHRARDLPVAKMFALRGLEIDLEAAWGDATRHRLARIERKMISERPSLFPS